MSESDLFLSALEIPGRPAEALPPQNIPNLVRTPSPTTLLYVVIYLIGIQVPAAPGASPSAAVDTPQQTTAQDVPAGSGAPAAPDSNTQKLIAAPVDTTEEMEDSQQEFMVTHTEVTQAKQELRQAAVDAKPEAIPMVSRFRPSGAQFVHTAGAWLIWDAADCEYGAIEASIVSNQQRTSLRSSLRSRLCS